MQLAGAARWYWYAVLGAALAGLGERTWRIVRGAHLPFPTPLLGAALVVALVVAQHLVVHWGPKRKFDLTMGLHYAIVVCYAGTGLVPWLVVIGWAVGQLVWLQRRQHGRPLRRWPSAVFNSAQAVVVVGLAALLYRWLPLPWAAPAAGLALVLLNPLIVSAMIALQFVQRSAPCPAPSEHQYGFLACLWTTWKRDRLFATLINVALICVGAVMATSAGHEPLVPLLMLAPMGALYASLYRQRRAEEATDARDAFLNVAAHELRTPITVLQGYVGLLQRQFRDGGTPGDPARVRRSLESVEAQAWRLASLVSQLTDLGQLSREQLAIRRELLDLAGVTADLARTLQPLCGHYRLVVEAGEPCFVVGDRVRLEQVLTNLVLNAVKYAQGGDQIRVAVGMVGERVHVVVQDYGMGMDAETVARAFERYYQAPNRRQVSGLGLGLYVCRQIVEAHGGQITCRSQLGHGTLFTWSVPVAPNVAPMPEGAALPATHTQRRKLALS